MGFWLFAGTIWIAMLGYSIMSAIFGFNKLRRIYLDLLRMLYRFLGLKMKSSQFRGAPEVETPSLSGGLPRVRSFKTLRHEFKMQDACDFITNGVEVIADDEVTKCFSTEEVEEWNFLTRTQVQMPTGLHFEALLLASIIFRFALFFLIRYYFGKKLAN